MLVRYLKRVRMEIDFRRTVLERAVLPPGFRWKAWEPHLLREHAAVKSASFRNEMDSHLFASLSTYRGCEELMRKISAHPGFLPLATWLIEHEGGELSGPVPCGTIQGIAMNSTCGSVQNVGVLAEYRGLGLGRALMLKSLLGFRRDGLLRITLDVTAENAPALKLYQSIGFRSISTTFRELPSPIEVGE